MCPDRQHFLSNPLLNYLQNHADYNISGICLFFIIPRTNSIVHTLVIFNLHCSLLFTGGQLPSSWSSWPSQKTIFFSHHYKHQCIIPLKLITQLFPTLIQWKLAFFMCWSLNLSELSNFLNTFMSFNWVLLGQGNIDR